MLLAITLTIQYALLMHDLHELEYCGVSVGIFATHRVMDILFTETGCFSQMIWRISSSFSVGF